MRPDAAAASQVCVRLLQVIPRAVKAVFSSVQEAMKEYDIAIHVTFVEIYNDEVGSAAITWRPMSMRSSI